jgi:hypothetical protein
MTNPYGTLIDGVVATSAILFIASLVYAYKLRTGSYAGSLTAEQVRVRGYILIGLWVILPPIWFFFEFQYLHPNMLGDPAELSRVKQAQDLGRNIWLAFIVVLGAIVGVKWPPGS